MSVNVTETEVSGGRKHSRVESMNCNRQTPPHKNTQRYKQMIRRPVKRKRKTNLGACDFELCTAICRRRAVHTGVRAFRLCRRVLQQMLHLIKQLKCVKPSSHNKKLGPDTRHAKRLRQVNAKPKPLWQPGQQQNDRQVSTTDPSNKITKWGRSVFETLSFV